MEVVKRNGRREPVDEKKILYRLSYFAENLKVDYKKVVKTTVSYLEDGIHTSRLDEISAETASDYISHHPDYDIFATRIIIDNHHKNTLNTFTDTMKRLMYDNYAYGEVYPILSDRFYKFVKHHRVAKKLDQMIDYERDFLYNNYFGFKVLCKSYLLKIKTLDGKHQIVERPQDLWMRVASFIHMKKTPSKLNQDEFDEMIRNIKETYDMLSMGLATHASPTLFNAGLRTEQLFSCFLLGMEDSLLGINKTMTDSAIISSSAGGIGIHLSHVRSRGARIRGTNGESKGIIPICRVLNEQCQLWNQGGRRNGSYAIYLEPHHPDIIDFLRLKRNDGNEEDRARELYYALWVSDEFMKRVYENQDWYLFDPDECRGLSDCWGEEYSKLYNFYIKEADAKWSDEKKKTHILPAQTVFLEFIQSQIRTGMPYLLFKDSANRRSNQKNIGTLTGSNLCAEIVEYVDKNEQSCCCLASICLPAFVRENSHCKFDFLELGRVVGILVRNLNICIDRNFYPTKETKTSNLSNRPLGIGVQGLADVFIRLGLSWEDQEAVDLNRRIFEAISYFGWKESCALAKLHGAYARFKGSPISKGEFEHNMAGYEIDGKYEKSSEWDWSELRKEVMEHGVRNSLITALMPTASTALIHGNTECFEPITSSIFVRETMAGRSICINKYLVYDLEKLNLWDEEMRLEIIQRDGNIQNISRIPERIRKIHKTAWDLSKRVVIDMASDRQAHISQTQSMNLYIKEPTGAMMSSLYHYAWKKGLITACYYLRSMPNSSAQKIAVEKIVKKKEKEQEECLSCQG